MTSVDGFWPVLLAGRQVLTPDGSGLMDATAGLTPAVVADPVVGVTWGNVRAQDALDGGPSWSPFGTAAWWWTWWWKEILLGVAALAAWRWWWRRRRHRVAR